MEFEHVEADRCAILLFLIAGPAEYRVRAQGLELDAELFVWSSEVLVGVADLRPPRPKGVARPGVLAPRL
jgi:hypothetical protein